MKVNGLVLAAGMSRRMQQFKPLMRIGDQTMIEKTVEQMLAAGVREITVVLGYRGDEVRQALTHSCFTGSLAAAFPAMLSLGFRQKVHFVYNWNYESTQMLESVKIGLQEMRPCDWFFVLPGDMPAISPATYQRLLTEAGGQDTKVVFPILDGYRKHPPLVSWSCREDILNFQGKGLRMLWGSYEGNIKEVPLYDEGCTMDVDYPEDYHKVCRYLSSAVSQ